jgi:prepilin-type N-terminal cleavage/methylation domain-containing protein
MRQHTRGGFTLIEIVFASAVLAVVMLGVGSSYAVAQNTQRMTNMRLAAMLAAQSVLDRYDVYVRTNQQTGAGYPANFDEDPIWDEVGFDVYAGTRSTGTAGDEGEMGLGSAAAGSSATVLKPAAPTTFPPSRLDDAIPIPPRPLGGSTVKEKALYVEILAPGDTGTPDFLRGDMRLVVVTVAWQSYGGDAKLTYTMIVGPGG